MANPVSARFKTTCEICEGDIEEGDDLFYHEDARHCLGCAEVASIVCSCGSYKKPDYNQCYDCWGG